MLHPVTPNWQAWFSLYGTDITGIFVSKDDDRAQAAQQVFLAELRSGGWVDRDPAKAFMAELQHCDDSELIDPLPQRSLETLAQQILRQTLADTPAVE
ncbi:hypothetical protein [Halomicronema sp. CCY15110]|uniref:hypothetical protein n=1 Tax=Halomicronema sp. CCY15110 TaxID=2767773 RepID=UPI0019512A20|nr:hypothetical protein [Halomicronema sp. CCY15110]